MALFRFFFYTKVDAQIKVPTTSYLKPQHQILNSRYAWPYPSMISANIPATSPDSVLHRIMFSCGPNIAKRAPQSVAPYSCKNRRFSFAANSETSVQSAPGSLRPKRYPKAIIPPVRTFVHHSRNTLDLSAVPVVRKESHLPIIIDPSHAAGRRDQVIPLSRAAIAVEAHGLMVEVHNAPEQALSDGAQSLYPYQFERLCRQVRSIFEVIQNGKSNLKLTASG